MTKVTLSVDEAIVKKAKQMARESNTSVSAMFTEFIRAMGSPGDKSRKIGPLTRQLSGIIKLPPGRGDRELLTDALMDKYRMAR